MVKITFLQNIMSEYPGVMCLSAVLKKHGHECDVVVSTKTSDYLTALHKDPPHIVGFSLMSGMQQWALDVAREIKREFPEMKIIFGGVHPTYFPDIIEEDGVDIICRGEGEYALLDILNALEEDADITTIPDLWVKKDGIIHKNELRPLVENLDELPFMDRRLYYDKYKFLRNRTVKSFIVARGCPHECSFCFNHKLKKMYEGKGRYVRFRSVENIIEEIDQVRREYGLKRILFLADNMFINKKWALTFLKEYGLKVRIPYICVIRADVLDEKIVKGLKESGCYTAWFGMESGNEEFRNIVLNKNITDAQIVEAARLLKKYGIKFRTFCMICLPGETVEQAYDTINLNIQVKTDYPWCSIYNPYSGTRLVEYAKEMGVLDEDFDIDSIDVSYYKKTILKSENIGELLNIQRFYQTAVLFPWTLPLIKKLVKLPPKFIFDLWFLFIYSIVHVKSEGHGFFESLKFGVSYLKVFYSPRG